MATSNTPDFLPLNCAYKTDKCLFQGVYGAVYTAKHAETSKSFALKAVFVNPPVNKDDIEASNANDEDEGTHTPEALLKRLCREVNLLAAIGTLSPYIVRLCDVFTCEKPSETYCLVMELMFKDLHTVLHEEDVAGLYNQPKPLPLPKVKKLGHQLLLGLAFLHHARIIHRDIKPHSLLVDEQLEHLKISNFTLARVSAQAVRSNLAAVNRRITRSLSRQFSNISNEEASLTNTISLGPSEEVLGLRVGIPSSEMQIAAFGYRAPELILGLPTYDIDIDIWSAGCTIAEMCSGEYLTPGENPMQLMIMMMNLFGKPTENLISQISPPSIQNVFNRWQYKGHTPWPHLVSIPSSEDRDSAAKALDLISKMVKWQGRISASDACKAPFFSGMDADNNRKPTREKKPEMTGSLALEKKIRTMNADELRQELGREIETFKKKGRNDQNRVAATAALPIEPSSTTSSSTSSVTSPTAYGVSLIVYHHSHHSHHGHHGHRHHHHQMHLQHNGQHSHHKGHADRGDKRRSLEANKDMDKFMLGTRSSDVLIEEELLFIDDD